ncbi:PBP1A family penicillin-binding protein [Desertifilum sp. FACHB-1129]|uniref:Penicillin-binding protein n=1 Tax=Desertifilum tharense IPPAS B-1220 TaxID=1781255 RepID=A0A1E5QF59_9CYAN|nr:MULTISPECIES: PBP1A family penicillin-binding protein [Desertifilum]MDA0213545.1 PBP1A family penicillin-binding protein [Cyanobacteria bacterium FC1]MBD2314959.1 PBP1A family penicillin-binding protein [Desertifilum sp. FACHB-1129]MBD2325220.1 PBP1A family penicillin-binding protein [Desertifilum sp. FACHB-866]MBD2335330.1 PBP1A family penicillin-binding protein [Desertifilum sp. FACHB-868]OEJ73241.1 penicillin-binding protein [Desertifilum tharense IPPAS B-1220]
MSSPQPPKQPRTLIGTITQAVQTVQAKVNFSKLVLKPNARVPQLLVQDADAPQADVYPLLGDRYLLGRSSKSCDIVIRNPVVSQVHLSLTRDRRRGPFILKDENSTNGIYRRKRRVSSTPLYHGDIYTLGPPELQASVRIQYQDPPPWYVRTARYALYGIGGMTALVASWVLWEWQKFTVYPMPLSVQGPVIVYARDEQPLVPPRGDAAHIELARLSDFSPHLAKALIASEDSRYYWHLGVDPVGTLRALFANLRGGEIREGGSTITQQLARSLFREYVGTQDSAGRKLREAVVAMKLETVYSKDRLLLTYLNRVYLGSNNFGFEDAAQFYFGKSATDLTLSEAATLVGILPAPNSFNPIRDYERAVRQRDGVIYRMVTLGMISQEEAQQARRSRIEVNPEALRELEQTIAPYFYDYVFTELESLLGTQLAREGNFIIETGLDPRIQSQAESSLRSTVTTTGASLGFDQGAVVTLDSSTGEIVAMVGGVDYQRSQFNRVTQAQRQPGSTFKVFAYAAAIAQGISPGTVYTCAPLNWGGQFYSGCERSSGAVDMYQGLAQSENSVALRIAQDAGLDRVIRMAQSLGIRSNLRSSPGLILGESEVTPLEMTGAFAVFANQGRRNRPHAIKRILDSSDCQTRDDPQTCRVIYDYTRNPEANAPVISPDVADTMTVLMQGVVAAGTGRAASIGFGDEAGKTGTTNDNVDLWFIGYLPSRNLATGIWLGNDNNDPTSGSSGIAAQLWSDYMRQIVR